MCVLWQNEIIVCQYLNPIWNRDITSLFTPTAIAGNCPLPSEIFAENDHPLEKRRFRQISVYNVSTVRDSEKLWRIESLPRAFQRAIGGAPTLPLTPSRAAQKAIFWFNKIKVNFNRIKPATNFLCVKTSSRKVVVRPFPCLTERSIDIGTKSNPST